MARARGTIVSVGISTRRRHAMRDVTPSLQAAVGRALGE